MVKSSKGELKVDPSGKSLQIDDLIITSNNVGNATGPDGGAALKNLAKIASRYQNQQQGASERSDSPGAKRARTESDDKSGQTLPASGSSTPKKPPGATSPNSQAAAAASLFGMLPAGMTWPLGTTPGATAGAASPGGTKGQQGAGAAAKNAAALAALTGFPMTDPSKLGPEGLHLLQYYEKQLKAAQEMVQKQQQAKPTNGKEPRGQSPATSVGSAPSSSSPMSTAASNKKEIREKDRAKVNKPPPDNKRPPSLMQTPCAFVQTSTIYTNPMAELQKLRGDKSGGSTNRPAPVPMPEPGSVMDLSRMPGLISAASMSNNEPDHLRHSSPGLGALNLKKEEQLRQQQLALNSMMDLSFKKDVKQPGIEPKASPFSAEALLSKPQGSASLSLANASNLARAAARLPGHQSLPSPQAPKHDLVKVAPISALTGSNPRYLEQDALRASKDLKMRPGDSPLNVGGHRASPASIYGSSAASQAQDKTSRTSPWHTPVSSNEVSALQHVRKEMLSGGKPAVPVSPQVREKERDALTAAAAAAAGFPPGLNPLAALLPPSSTVSTSLGLHSSLTTSSLSMAAGAASNPYLALMGVAGVPGAKGAASSSAAASAAAAAAAAGYPPHLMDPATSAYYAALYSQQMYGAAGLNPYASLAASLRMPSGAAAGLPPAPPGGAPSVSAAAAAAALDPMQAQALHHMLSGRGAGAPGSAASANPYAAAYSGLAGLPGYPPGFPAPRKD